MYRVGILPSCMHTCIFYIPFPLLDCLLGPLSRFTVGGAAVAPTTMYSTTVCTGTGYRIKAVSRFVSPFRSFIIPGDRSYDIYLLTEAPSDTCLPWHKYRHEWRRTVQ